MCTKEKASIAFKVLLGGLLISVFFACAMRTSLSPGAWVEENNRITMQDGGPYKGSWQTRDLTIDYEYRESAKNLEVSGTIKLADYITNGFSTLDYLKIYINFLTPDGVVLETKNLQYFGYFRQLDYLEKMTFKSRFDLPENTAAFAFSYSGGASQGGGSGGAGQGGGGGVWGANSPGGSAQSSWEFWKIPRRSPPK